MATKMIEVPILERIGSTKLIGTVKIDEASLPDTPDFCLAIGFNRKDDFSYKTRVFVVVDDADYTKAMLEQYTPIANLILDIKQKSKQNGSNSN